jgi:hypothetical protein
MAYLHENLLRLEAVTLGKHVELVVEVLVDLLGVAVLAEHAAEDAHAAHPEDLLRHAGTGGTTALTVASVAALVLLGLARAGAVARVDDGRLLDDEAILDELLDVLARVGHGDLGGLVRVEPDLALAALEDRRREALLKLEGHHC